MKLRAPAWFVDHDTLGLAHAHAELRDDVTYPGDTGERRHGKWQLPPCPVPLHSVDDDVWIPQVARLGWAIITRDKHIQTRTWEVDAVAASNARMFAITSEENLDNWGLIEVVASRWRDMTAAAADPGPLHLLADADLDPQDRHLRLAPFLLASSARVLSRRSSRFGWVAPTHRACGPACASQRSMIAISDSRSPSLR